MNKGFHIHLVSDATGETVHNLLRACLVQFPGIQVEEHFYSLIRSSSQLQMALENVERFPGPVFYTFVDTALKEKLETFCLEKNLTFVSVLQPVLEALTSFFGLSSANMPGRQHALDEAYFARVQAIDFAMSLDDGNNIQKWKEADVLILGVSRTTKTPTCFYLAHRGIKAANWPLVPGIAVPDRFFEPGKTLLVGLTEDLEKLVEVRKSRMKYLDPAGSAAYIDPEKVQEELSSARRLFTKLDCPVINITHRSVEETAAEILMLLQHHKKTDAP